MGPSPLQLRLTAITVQHLGCSHVAIRQHLGGSLAAMLVLLQKWGVLPQWWPPRCGAAAVTAKR